MPAFDQIKADAIVAFAQGRLEVIGKQTRWDHAEAGFLGQRVRLAENIPHVLPWFEDHLCPPPDDQSTTQQVTIYSAPDAFDGHPPYDWFDYLPDGLLAQILAKSGLFGRLSRDPFVWELYDPEEGVGVRLQRRSQSTFVWEETAPIANFLSWIARGTGRGMYHSASLGRNGTGVLILGAGGSGKSGTTLSGVSAGL